jgi:hypothetical protein
MTIQMRDEKSKKMLIDTCSRIMGMNKSNKMIEIGCYTGESTSAFSEVFGEVYAIDPWIVGMNLIEGKTIMENSTCIMDSSVELGFDKTIESRPNIKKIKAFDYDVINQFEDYSVDFIYIDAIHTREEIERQITMWLPKIKKDGWIGGHDFSESFRGVIEGVRSKIGEPTLILNDYGTSWLKKLTEPVRF